MAVVKRFNAREREKKSWYNRRSTIGSTTLVGRGDNGIAVKFASFRGSRLEIYTNAHVHRGTKIK